MTTKQPRGLRNNNPGNIRKSNAKWQGLAPSQPDSEFATFKDPTWGIRALARTLITYQDKYDLNTVRGIISRWAPPVENNTESYIKTVANAMGVNANAAIDVHEFKYLEPLVKAIIKHENGQQPYTDAQITKGLVLAGVEPPRTELAGSRTIKAAQVAGGATALSAVAEGVQTVAPAFGLIEKIAEYAPYVLAIVAIAAIGYIVWSRIDDRRKGLR